MILWICLFLRVGFSPPHTLWLASIHTRLMQIFFLNYLTCATFHRLKMHLKPYTSYSSPWFGFSLFIYLTYVWVKCGRVDSTACMRVPLLLRCIIHLHQQPPKSEDAWTFMCCLFDLSLFQKCGHYMNLTLRHQTWQLIAVKSGTKKVAITHSAGGPSEITIIPNRHFRQQPWLSQHGQWTHLSKIKCALHLAGIVLCISMGGTYSTPIKCLLLVFSSWSPSICATSPLNSAI